MRLTGEVLRLCAIVLLTIAFFTSVPFRQNKNDSNLAPIDLHVSEDATRILQEIQSDIFLDIDIANKEVQRIHDFFHKILIYKILNSSYSRLEISDEAIKKESFFKEESFIKLNDFLLEIIVEFNKKLELLFNQVSKT